ncbi:MAG: hypothetical protein IJ223_06300 [Clostridia bacterium]|nr:hypothetical protein [Clostridia bacterium]
MERNTIIIVEGPQGAGKTTFTNYLREHLASVDLHRLTGIKDKTKTGLEKVTKRFQREMDYIKAGCLPDAPLMLYDRNFFTDEIYARLGYKEYSFNEAYQNFLKQLDNMDLNIYFVVLYLENEELYRERLAGRDKFEYQKFDITNSINQQNEYLKMADEVEKQTKNIRLIRFANDTEENFDERIRELFGNLMK